MLKSIIVDDEELAIERLTELLTETGKLEIKNSFLEPNQAVEFIKNNDIDVAFLDISLPEMNGLVLADLIMNIKSSIDIVFVTGYDDYAVKAFELNALDYLLKPVTYERLQKTIDKIEKARKQKTNNTYAKILCLGGFDIIVEDKHKNIKWRTSKAEELLAFLIHNRCKSISRDYLIDNLWQETDIEKAMDNLNATTYYLRKALDTIGITDCIKTNKSEIWIESEKISCDVYLFEDTVKEIVNISYLNIKEIETAIELYKGEYLKNKYYSWADGKRERLENLYICILNKTSEYYLNENMISLAENALKKILTIEPLFEEIHEKLIKLYILSNNRIEAEKHYKRLKKTLAEELDVEPNINIQKLMGYI